MTSGRGGAFRYELLLGVHDLGRVDILEVRREVGLDGLKVLTCGESADIGLEQGGTVSGGARSGTIRRAIHTVDRIRGSRVGFAGSGFHARRVDDGETSRLELCRDLAEVVALDGATLGDGHHTSDGVERHGLGDVRKTDASHHIFEFGVVCDEVVDGAGKIESLCHGFS